MGKIKKIFSGKVIKLTLNEIKLPNGRETRIEKIEHPGAVLVIPFLSWDKIILIKQFRPVINCYIYELPAGTLEKGESSLECARREITEEVGYQAKFFKKLGFIYSVPGYSTEIITIYRADKLKKKYSVPDRDEIIKPEIFTKKEIRQLFYAGKIVDAKTISALALSKIL